MRTKKINKMRVNEETDTNTGEVKKESYNVSYELKMDNSFIKFYRDSYNIFGMLSSEVRRVLDYFILKAEYNTNRITIRYEDREQLSINYHCSISAINKKIDKLVRFGILIRDFQRNYTLNPHLCGFGEGRELEKLRAECEIKPSNIIKQISLDKQVEKVYVKNENSSDNKKQAAIAQ